MHIMCDLLCLFRPVRSGVSALDIFIVMKMIFTHVHSLILVLLQIVDSPGLCDTKLSEQETSIIIMKTVVGLHPGPHALLYVVKTERFTNEEYQVFKKLETLFDKNIYNYLVVIFTGGDNFEHDGLSPVQAIEQAPPTLKQLLKDCKQRYVVFNNRAANPRPQVEKLLGIVRAMVKENGDRPHYSCDKHKAAGEKLEAEVKRLIADVEQQILEEKEEFKAHMQNKKRQMEQDFEKKKEEYEEKVKKQLISRSEANDRLQEELEKQKQEQLKLARKLEEIQITGADLVEKERVKFTTKIKEDGVEGGFISGVKQLASGAYEVLTSPFGLFRT